MLNVALLNLWGGRSIKEATDARRLHHQVFPMNLEYEFGVSQVSWNRNHWVFIFTNLFIFCLSNTSLVFPGKLERKSLGIYFYKSICLFVYRIRVRCLAGKLEQKPLGIYFCKSICLFVYLVDLIFLL